jgi:hypothetical protein
MQVGSTTATMAAHTLDSGERLPWTLAGPLIGGLSLGLWLAIWEVARLALAG